MGWTDRARKEVKADGEGDVGERVVREANKKGEAQVGRWPRTVKRYVLLHCANGGRRRPGQAYADSATPFTFCCSLSITGKPRSMGVSLDQSRVPRTISNQGYLMHVHTRVDVITSLLPISWIRRLPPTNDGLWTHSLRAASMRAMRDPCRYRSSRSRTTPVYSSTMPAVTRPPVK